MIPIDPDWEPIDYSFQDEHPILCGIIMIILLIIAIPYFICIGIFWGIIFLKEKIKSS